MPETTILLAGSRRLIVGWLARAVKIAERTPPSEGFVPTERDSWRGSLIVVDPADHADGQKVALEKRTDVGSPLSALQSLCRNMRIGEDPRPFDVQVFPITEESSFWKFAQRHDYSIASLTFEVAPPNMFGGADEFSQELRDLRSRNNVSQLKATLQSDTALDVQQENIKQIVDYTEKGVGRIRARTTTNARYSSTEHGTHDQLDADADEPGFWDQLRSWLQERF